VKIKQDEILRNDGHRGGNEVWNRSENVWKMEVRHGEYLDEGRFACRRARTFQQPQVAPCREG
jgi:hypothetical protein